MLDVLFSFLSSFRVYSQTSADTQLEILALRHQINVLQRKVPKPRLTAADRRLWVFISRFWSRWRSALVLVRPDTVIGWHRRGFRWFCTWKVRHGNAGRPGVPKEIRELIRRMCRENVLWGAPRIQSELLKLGIKISLASVTKYMVRNPKLPSQTSRKLLTNHVSQVVSDDFFSVPTISFQILYVLIVLAHDRRRILHFNLTAHPTADWTGQQIVETFPFQSAPSYLLRDRDRIYGSEFQNQLGVMNINEVLSAPGSPWQNPFVERVIGSIRQECLDHVIIFSEESLRRALRSYTNYYHASRLHLSLEKTSPDPRAVQSIGKGFTIPQVGGLHQRNERRAA